MKNEPMDIGTVIAAFTVLAIFLALVFLDWLCH
jgi:hypothetical protein